MGFAECVKEWSLFGLLFVYSLQFGTCQLIEDGHFGRKDKVQMTVMSFKPQNAESTEAPLPHYECYLGAEDGDAVVSSSRPYRTRNFEEPQPSKPDLLVDSNLPANTAAYSVSLDHANSNAFGIFTCDASKEGRQNTTIFTIFFRSNAYILPTNELFTKTVNIGDRGVTIDMTIIEGVVDIPGSPSNPDIRWRINGGGSVHLPNGGGTQYVNEDFELLSSRSITVNDEGAYEAVGFLLRDRAQHALQRLIVRSCVAGRWGPPGCNSICDNCYNGGVCDDETGRCICPPGFMGGNCLTACDANRFGYSCEFQCDYAGNTDCTGRQFCLLDPYGCTCNTGYEGLDCMTECEDNKYGAGCLQQCHCDGSQGRCNRFTGVCNSGRCQSGWSGSNCQIPEGGCSAGYFGSSCTEKCLCINNVACDRDTGECINGVQCAPGAMKPMDSVRCQECPDGFYGNSCNEECHCSSDACDKATGECVGCCKPQWLDTESNTCKAGIEGSSYMTVNSGQSTTVRCDVSQSISSLYRSELSREMGSVINSGIISRGTTTGVNNQGSLIITADFTINNASSTDIFYCLLVSNMEPVAWLNTTFVAYELPVLTDPPTANRLTNDSITIGWRTWDEDEDVGDPPVVSYVTYYKEEARDVWMRGSYVSPDVTLEFVASDLKMDVNYTFAVAVVRDGVGGEGPRGPPLIAKTLCEDPAVPIDVQASLTNDNQVELSWQIPPGSVTCSTGIISFTVYAQIEGSNDEPIRIATVGGEMTSYIISEGLEDGVSYSFLVSSTTDREGAQSTRSEAIMYTLGPSPVTLIVIVLVLGVVTILILVVVKRYHFQKGPQDKSKSNRAESAVFKNDGVSNEPIGYSSLELDPKEASSPSDYRDLQHGDTTSEYEETDMSKMKRNIRGYEYEDIGNSQPGGKNLPKSPIEPQTNSAIQRESHDYEEPGDFENYTGVYINIPDTHHHLSSPEPIKVSEFQSFMRKDHTQLIEGIVKEFVTLFKERQYPCSVGQQHQQRYYIQEILPYDHSRVVLTSLGNVNESYYNASYIKDLKGKISFIAAQGPRNQYKISDFWRMIWQDNVKIIVMLTDSDQAINANGNAVYWPEKVQTSATYGELTVLGMESTNCGTYTVRKMKVLQNDDDKIHTVQQVQLHTWPFRGVPDDITDLTAIIKNVKSLQQGRDTSPLLVHCSNGSGATGTFIAIYSLMDVLKESKTISVFDFVSKMRKDRMDMVQTRIQYLFIYQALQNAQLFPEDSSLSLSQLKNLSDRILIKKAEKEFEALRKMEKASTRQAKGEVGTLATNANKNRFKGIAPLDKYRVILKSSGLTHGSSDYINASVAENDGSRYTFMTQSPLPATVEDFWRLVYDYQCRTIIMLNNANNEDKTLVQYWPDGRATYGAVKVDFVTSTKFEDFTKRAFTVSHQNFKESVSVEQYVYDGVLEKKMQDTDVDKLAKFISSANSDKSKTSVVHCINGVGLSAVYVVVRSLMESVKNGDDCDVFLSVQRLRMRNPHVIQTQDEYMLCLQLLRSIFNNQEEYVVVY